MTSAPATAPPARLMSVDALRGFDMFWIIGGDALFIALAKWGDWPFSKKSRNKTPLDCALRMFQGE